MVSIALLDDFIEASRLSCEYSTEQLHSSTPLCQFLAKELNDSVLCKPIAVVQVKNPELEFKYVNTVRVFNNLGYPLEEAFLYHATKAPLQTVCEVGLIPSPNTNNTFGGPAIYLAQTIRKANRYVNTYGDVSQVRAVLRCRVLLGRSKEYPLGHHDHYLKTAPKGFQSVKGFIANGVEYVVYSPNQVLITEVIFYRVLSLGIDKSRMFVPCDFSGIIAFIDPYLSFMFSNLVNNESLDCEVVYRLIYQLITRTMSLSEFLIVFSHALDQIYPPERIVKRLENALAMSTAVVNFTDGLSCQTFDPSSRMAFQLGFMS